MVKSSCRDVSLFESVKIRGFVFVGTACWGGSVRFGEAVVDGRIGVWIIRFASESVDLFVNSASAVLRHLRRNVLNVRLFVHSIGKSYG